MAHEQRVNKSQIRQRIAELERRREAFVAEANVQIALLNGAIAELTALLDGPKTTGTPLGEEIEA